MPAYLIVAAVLNDRDGFLASGYPGAAAELVQRFGGRYLVRAANAELLEGDFGDRGSVVISEWPDREVARRFWTSAEYQEVKKLREPISRCQVLLVDAA
jgi:uncharacterized protein (DUF1330 family)